MDIFSVEHSVGLFDEADWPRLPYVVRYCPFGTGEAVEVRLGEEELRAIQGIRGPEVQRSRLDDFRSLRRLESELDEFVARKELSADERDHILRKRALPKGVQKRLPASVHLDLSSLKKLNGWMQRRRAAPRPRPGGRHRCRAAVIEEVQRIRKINPTLKVSPLADKALENLSRRGVENLPTPEAVRGWITSLELNDR